MMITLTDSSVDTFVKASIISPIILFERAFIVLRGVTSLEERRPPRFFKEPIPSGPAKGEILEKDKYNRMLDEYYQLRGWNKDGVPRKDKLAELGLDYVAKDLEKQGKL